MKILIFAAAAVTAYLVAGWNPAITFSKGIYKKDIRECGSGNPGFTNFRRTFGNKWAWCVLLLDILKSAAVVAFWAEVMDARWSCYELGASFTAFFALLGHAFPLWYRFRGGKGFLVCLSGVWVMDWRAGLMATLLMVIILLAARYMSLATVVSLLCCPPLLALMGASLPSLIFCEASALFVAVRHKENFKRLVKGTEPKFNIKPDKRRGAG